MRFSITLRAVRTIYTDELSGLRPSGALDYIHATVNHMEEYVQRRSSHSGHRELLGVCLKRTLRGTYVAVEPFHLDRYVGEQVFRFNNRATKDNPLDDADRFHLAMSQSTASGLPTRT